MSKGRKPFFGQLKKNLESVSMETPLESVSNSTTEKKRKIPPTSSTIKQKDTPAKATSSKQFKQQKITSFFAPSSSKSSSNPKADPDLERKADPPSPSLPAKKIRVTESRPRKPKTVEFFFSTVGHHHHHHDQQHAASVGIDVGYKQPVYASNVIY